MHYEPTIEQAAIIEQLIDWISSTDDQKRGINLQAKAGSGKTSTLAYFLKEFCDDFKVNIIAPTHAALAQLHLRMGDGYNYLTVAKAMGLVPIADTTNVEVRFGFSRARILEGITIVDESSMLSEMEVNWFLSACQKVIFSGDNNQLPPVKKKSGKAVLDSLQTLTILHNFRASGNIASAGYNAIIHNKYVPPTSEDNTVICHEDYEEFLKTFLDKVVLEPIGEVVAISYLNEDVAKFNLLAHQARTGRTTLEVGDVVKLHSNSKLGHNNFNITVETCEISQYGYIISTEGSPKVEVAMPHQYPQVAKEIAAIVKMFQNNNGSDELATKLNLLRSIVEIDYPYAITCNKSQGSTISTVFAYSPNLRTRKSFYVAYSRASQCLHVCKMPTKNTRGDRGVNVVGSQWYNKHTEALLELDPSLVYNATAVYEAIKQQYSENAPSKSAVCCVLNPQHASKSAKGWTLR